MGPTNGDYDPAADPVHGRGWNSATRYGGWSWREPRDGEWFRTCSFCGCIHPEDLAPELVEQGPCTDCERIGWEACFDGQRHLGEETVARVLADPAVPDQDKAKLRDRHPRHSYDPGGAYLSWADFKYGWPHKAYVKELRNREPGRLHVISARYRRDDAPLEPEPGWIRPSEIPEGAVSGWDNLSGVGEVQLGRRPTLFAKFYTVHLKDPAIGQDAKDAIGRAGGLRLEFTDDGRVSWRPWQAS